MRIGVVVVFAVAGQTAEEYALVLAIPMVDRKHDETLVNAPSVGKSGYERAVDHIPKLAVVLLLLVEDAVEGCTAFAHGETAEFGEDIRFINTTDGADIFDLRKHFLRHVFIVVGGGEGGFAGESTADIE